MFSSTTMQTSSTPGSMAPGLSTLRSPSSSTLFVTWQRLGLLLFLPMPSSASMTFRMYGSPYRSSIFYLLVSYRNKALFILLLLLGKTICTMYGGIYLISGCRPPSWPFIVLKTLLMYDVMCSEISVPNLVNVYMAPLSQINPARINFLSSLLNIVGDKSGSS